MRNHSYLRWWTLACLAALLLLVGCGGDAGDVDTEATSDSDGAEAPPAAEPADELEIAAVLTQLADGTGGLNQSQQRALQGVADGGATCDAVAGARARPRISQVEVEVITIREGCLRFSYDVANFRSLVDDLQRIRQPDNVIAASPLLLDYRLNQDDVVDLQWQLDAIETIPLSPGSGPTGEGIVIAIIDSGIDTDYPGIDAARVTRAPDSGTGDYTETGHGTIAAAIITSPLGDAERGLAPSAQLLDVPADLCAPEDCGCDPCAPMTPAEAVRWSTDNGADIISMSFGYQPLPRPAWWQLLIDGGELDSATETIEVALAYANASGLTMTAAAGNCAQGANRRCETEDQFEVPAGYRDVVGVGAMASDDDGNPIRASYSTRQSYVDIAAPGSLTLPGTDGEIATKNGTSYATPFVAAALALMTGDDGPLAGRPDAQAVAREILFDSAIDLAPEGKDAEFGHGQLQLVTALQQAEEWAIENPFTPTPVPDNEPDS